MQLMCAKPDTLAGSLVPPCSQSRGGIAIGTGHSRLRRVRNNAAGIPKSLNRNSNEDSQENRNYHGTTVSETIVVHK